MAFDTSSETRTDILPSSTTNGINYHHALSPSIRDACQLQYPSCHITQQGGTCSPPTATPILPYHPTRALVLLSILSSHSKGWTGVMSSSTAQLHRVPPANVQGVGPMPSYHGEIGTALGHPMFAFLHLHLVFGQLVRTTPGCISAFAFGIRVIGTVCTAQVNSHLH